MRVVLQRVTQAAVVVGEEKVAQIGTGLCILLAVGEGDGAEEVAKLATKVVQLRIFRDEAGYFNRSILDLGGEALVVSQFTLYADCRKGRRPSFSRAARPEQAEPLVDDFAQALRLAGVPTQTGIFGAMMSVEIHNDGPVTIILDSDELARPR
ncbi:MAG: D-tyrosyl-tRNA(Tyr) deacylase [Chloroflexia bacterium]|nr:D-tyrosyl-tRNA(Tyr) deacylase [Chloroflexia bacterium]